MANYCKSEFDNCGPDADGDYCLMHKPDKTEKESREFYKKLSEIIEENLRDSEDTENSSEKKVYTEKLNLKGYIFPRIPTNSLNNTSSIIKNQILDFSNKKFEDEVHFNDAKFCAKTHFKDVKFGERAKFKLATFKDDINFNEAIFKNVTHFDGSKFEGEAQFKEVEFHDKITFKFVEFVKGVYFESSEFKKKADFRHAKFNDEVKFDYTYFGRYSEFTNTKFKSLSFQNSYFPQGLSIIGNDNQEKEEEKNTFQERFQTPKAKKEASKIQKITYEKEGNKEQADEMFRKEMRARRKQKQRSGNTWDEIISIFEKPLADWTCEYGTNWMRVIGWSLFTIFVSFFVYWLGSPELGSIRMNGESGVSNLLSYLYYSVITFTTLGYGDMYPRGILSGVSALESLLGAFFMALIIAVFARKWMR